GRCPNRWRSECGIVSGRTHYRRSRLYTFPFHRCGYVECTLPRGCKYCREAPALMDAEIIAVGSELLTPQRIDTNSLYLTDQLNALGIEVVQKSIVGDDRARLVNALHNAV